MSAINTKQGRDGYKVKRICEISSVKGEDYTEKLDLSQQMVSKLEQADTVKYEQLEAITKDWHVPVGVIKNNSDDAALNILVSALHDNSSIVLNYYPIFNYSG